MPTSLRRITLIIHALSGGGAERQITSLANHLSRLGHLCTLITLDSIASDRYDVDSSVARVGLNTMKESGSILVAIAENRRRIGVVRNAIRQSEPDTVISFCDKMNIIALAACRTLSIPIIISERSDPRRQKLGWFWEAGRRWYYPTASACVVQTSGVAEYLRPILGPSVPIEIIASAIESPLKGFHEREYFDNGVSQLLFVGRLSQEKGADRLIKVWATMAGKYPSWKLAIAGEGPLESSLRQLCVDLEIQSRVDFLGWQNDVWPLLAESQAFVLPSLYEGFPGAILEAMYAGLPVVANDCSESIGQIIQHEQSGLIAQNNPSSLSIELERLLSDPCLRDRLGTAARRVATHYLWSEKIEDWNRLIEQVIRKVT